VLRALEEGVVTRIGAAKAIEVDVRVIAATNKSLEDEIAANQFREDLYYRLNVVPVEVPPLGARKEDIPLLVDKFTNDLTDSFGIRSKRFSKDALEDLARRDWPGNVRELRNAVERLLILSASDTVTASDVARIGGHTQESELGNLMLCDTFEIFKQEAEKAFLQGKLADNSWNVSETARKLSMPRSNLYKKIEKYGMERK